MGPERRGRAVHGRLEVNPSGEEPTDRPRQKNAGLWEPYDGRLSRTVLREREGEVPSRYSPGRHWAGSHGRRHGSFTAAPSSTSPETATDSAPTKPATVNKQLQSNHPGVGNLADQLWGISLIGVTSLDIEAHAPAPPLARSATTRRHRHCHRHCRSAR